MRDRRGFVQLLPQIFRDQLDERAARAGEEEGILRPAAFARNDDEVLGKKLRLARDRRSGEINRLRKRLPVPAPDENDFVRLFVRRDEGAKQIRGYASAATADTGNGPGDGFAEEILFAEYRRETRGQRDR